MKILRLTMFLVFLFTAFTLTAQEKKYEGFSFGNSAGISNGINGFGIELLSPLLFDIQIFDFYIGKVGFFASGSLHTYQGLIEGRTKETQTFFPTAKGGIILAQPLGDYGFRNYTKVAFLTLFANSDIDSTPYSYGIYNDLGFEFFPQLNADIVGFFIEFGSNMLFPAATADNASSTNPIYFDGFSLMAGSRFYF
jgi:hypothetical protein